MSAAVINGAVAGQLECEFQFGAKQAASKRHLHSRCEKPIRPAVASSIKVRLFVSFGVLVNLAQLVAIPFAGAGVVAVNSLAQTLERRVNESLLKRDHS